MIDWALETYTMIGEEQPQELIDRHEAWLCFWHWHDKLRVIESCSFHTCIRSAGGSSKAECINGTRTL